MICPRSAILQSAAASIVEGTFGFTVSMAERIATRGLAKPSAWHRSIAFWTMSTLSSSVGKMLMAASVTITARSMAGTSITKQWLMRRAVRNPLSGRTTALMSSSVCRLPFMIICALPSRASRTASAAADAASSASTISKREMSSLAFFATSAMRALGPTRIGISSFACAPSTAPRSDDSSQGYATAVGTGS